MYPLWAFFTYYVWYSNIEGSTFHFFDDSQEWLQMDKVGHAVTMAQWALMPTFIFCWAGYSLKKSALYSFLFSTVVLVPVEIMDGFSDLWGFSVYDFTCNLLGSLIIYLQLLFYKGVVMLPKYSFHQTFYALVRPDMFGTDYVQNSMKDYNGQTYWLTFDVNKLFGRKILPSWLLFSIGYGAEGLYGGHDNVWTDKNGVTHDYSHVERYRQFYISFDINFAHIIKNKRWQRILYGINIFKTPFPALEFSERGVVFHWLYY